MRERCVTKISRQPALYAICAIACATAAAQPKFEEASVKRTDQCGVSASMGPGTVVLRGIPLKFILVEAFKVKKDQIAGPSWLDEDCFEIVAKIPEGATGDQTPVMLQALLIERFKLATRKEDRPRQIYALILDKNGPKFQEANPGSQRPGTPRGAMTFSAAPGIAGFKGQMTMASLALRLSNKLDRPVHDVTGLPGTYDIDLSWTPDPAFERNVEAHPADPAPNAKPDLFTAIRESLGLKLEPRKEPVETRVIEHIERIPTGN